MKKILMLFLSLKHVVAEINMKGTEFVRDYTFKLHKDAIVKQLTCFLKKRR